jgi:alpha-mannosidase
VTKSLTIPKYLDAKTLKRSEERAVLTVESVITLNRDSANVTVETTIDNTARDHRLKLTLPTNTKGETYFAGQAFCKVTRPVGTDPEKASWDEPECIERNMNGIIGKQSVEGDGLAFVSAEGLHEAGVLDDTASTIAVTLYRCFDRVFMQTESYLSQLQRKLTFKYSVVPMTADTSYADLLSIQHQLKDTEITVVDKVSAETLTPKAESHLSIENDDVVLSLFKACENGYVVRMFNTTDVSATTTVKLTKGSKLAFETDLLENSIQELEMDCNTVKLTFKPWEIKTVKFIL